MRIAPLVLFALLSLHSQEPSTTPSALTQAKQDKAHKKDGIVTDQQLQSGKGVPSIPQPKKQNQDGHQTTRNDDTKKAPLQKDIADWLPNWIMAGFTIVLAGLAAAQFWAMHRQAEYMRDGLGLSRQAASAATKSADAAGISADIARQSSESAVAAVAEAAKISAAMLDASRTIATAQENANKLKLTQSQIDSIYRSSDH